MRLLRQGSDAWVQTLKSFIISGLDYRNFSSGKSHPFLFSFPSIFRQRAIPTVVPERLFCLVSSLETETSEQGSNIGVPRHDVPGLMKVDLDAKTRLDLSACSRPILSS